MLPKMSGLILALMGLLVNLLVWILSDIALAWKLLTLASAIALFFTFLYVQNLRRNPGKSLTGASQGLSFVNQIEAFREILRPGLSKLIVIAYTGNITHAALQAYAVEHNGELPSNSELQLLIRNPDSVTSWSIPAKEEGKAIRRQQILSNISSFRSSSLFKDMLHRRNNLPESSFVRYYNEDPKLRAVLAEFSDSTKVLFLGMYTIERRDYGDDFASVAGPMIRIDNTNGQGRVVMDRFQKWFASYWNGLAIKR